MRFRTIALASSSVLTMLACTDTTTPVENRRAVPDTPAASVFSPTATTNECGAVQPGWIFCDDFEQDRTGKYFEYDNAGGRFVRSSGNGINGSTSMRAQYLAGQTSAGSLHLAIGRTPSTYFRPADAGTANYRELYWRVYVKRQAGWTGNGPWKLARAQIIAKSDWTQAMIAHFWSDETNTKYLLADPASGTDASGNLITSGYNDFTHLRWLGGVRTDSTYDDNAHGGVWQCMEFHARLNDAGQSNAVQEMWVDGRLAERKSGFNWVGSYSAYGINNIFLEQYWNNGAAATEYRDLDNFVVSTQPIGCGGSTTTTITSSPTVAAVKVSPASSTVLVAQTVQLAATDLDAGGNVLSGQTNTWASSNNAVATVSSTGLVTGIAAGTVTVTASSGGHSGSATVAVSTQAPTLAAISVSPASSSLLAGQTAQLAATDIDNSGKVMTGVANSWSSSNSAVASVSSSGVVTAVAAGTATIKATSGTVSGSATVSVTATTTTTTTSSGDFANQPAGFTSLTSRPFNSVARSCSDATAAEGWDPGEECSWSHISIISDPTAPKSPNNVLQAWYPAGTTGGTINATPGRIVKNFSSAQQVYVSIWVKLSSNFVGNGTWTNKVFFIWINGSPNFFMSAEGAGTGTLAPTGRLQGTMDTREKLPPNLVTSAAVQRGVWQHWEVLVKANTPGVSNGEFHLWVNGQKVSQYTNVGYLSSGQTTGFMKMDIEPIWGGGGSTLSADQYMYFDHAYVSKP